MLASLWDFLFFSRKLLTSSKFNITTIINNHGAYFFLTLRYISVYFLKIVILLFYFSLTRHEAGLLETMNSKYQAFGTLDRRGKKTTKTKLSINMNFITFCT